MALIECKECGSRISDAAKACVHCGCPIAPRAPAEPAVTKPFSSSRSHFQCPKCGSEEVKTLPLVVASGTTNLSTSTITFGGASAGGTLGIGVAASSTTGSQKTQLADSVAEPQPMQPDLGPAVGAGCVGGCLTVLLMAAVGAAIGSVFGGTPAENGAEAASMAILSFGTLASAGSAYMLYDMAKADADNDYFHKARHLKWQRSFLCMRCGQLTDPAELPVA